MKKAISVFILVFLVIAMFIPSLWFLPPPMMLLAFEVAVITISGM